MKAERVSQALEEAKVISVRSQGNLANRMIQYMAALAISDRVVGSVVTGVTLPEWNIPHLPSPESCRFERELVISPSNASAASIRDLSVIARGLPSVQIILDHHMQMLELFDTPRNRNGLFAEPERRELGDNELLIHIRAGDILVGYEHYPLLPITYFHWLVHISGLSPVFCGQIGDSLYAATLRREFPNARFIEARTPIEDFQLLRSARHIAHSVSTFSWLAAWLSRAETVFLPLCGFFSPVYMREVDLLPTSDARYRFVQFPLYFGVDEVSMLEHHKRIESTWKEISPRQVALLRDASPFLTPRTSDIPFDPIWYTHTYLDAAREVSEGWFNDPLHHYLEVGQLRGYQPMRQGRWRGISTIPGRNLALDGYATQSSVSQWSHGKTVETDAAIAINGRVWEDKFFHTDADLLPWWRVDLQVTRSISCIRIFNRDGPDAIQKRAAPLLIQTSLDDNFWHLLFQIDADQVFGGRSGRPFLWIAPAPVKARFVKITLQRQDVFHLAEVEVYGLDDSNT